MLAINNESWDDYVADSLKCPDPVGYLGATRDIVSDLKAFLDNASSASDFQRQVRDYILDREQFAAFGFHYMESKKFLNHVEAVERDKYSPVLPTLG